MTLFSKVQILAPLPIRSSCHKVTKEKNCLNSASVKSKENKCKFLIFGSLFVYFLNSDNGY